MKIINVPEQISDAITLSGYAVASKEELALDSEDDNNLKSLMSLWDDLVIDRYLPPQYGERYRRYGRFRFDKERFSLNILPNEGYIQSYQNNSVSGGIKRIFAPLQPVAISNDFFQLLIKSNAHILHPMGQRYWDIHAHFIRIPSNKKQQGVPCPEGIHNDGFSFISIHLMNAYHIDGAHSTLYDINNNIVGSVTLRKTLDSIYADDRRIRHYTSPFDSIDGASGYRDTLLLSYDPV